MLISSGFAKLRHEAGYRTASYDREFNAKTMDSLSPAGFLLLGFVYPYLEMPCPKFLNDSWDEVGALGGV